VILGPTAERLRRPAERHRQSENKEERPTRTSTGLGRTGAGSRAM
jgi:hypothetical protein